MMIICFLVITDEETADHRENSDYLNWIMKKLTDAGIDLNFPIIYEYCPEQEVTLLMQYQKLNAAG